jgi:hypothetical protein
MLGDGVEGSVLVSAHPAFASISAIANEDKNHFIGPRSLDRATPRAKARSYIAVLWLGLSPTDGGSPFAIRTFGIALSLRSAKVIPAGAPSYSPAQLAPPACPPTPSLGTFLVGVPLFDAVGELLALEPDVQQVCSHGPGNAFSANSRSAFASSR